MNKSPRSAPQLNPVNTVNFPLSSPFQNDAVVHDIRIVGRLWSDENDGDEELL